MLELSEIFKSLSEELITISKRKIIHSCTVQIYESS